MYFKGYNAIFSEETFIIYFIYVKVGLGESYSYHVNSQCRSAREQASSMQLLKGVKGDTTYGIFLQLRHGY